MATPECLDCGACCFVDREHYVMLGPADTERLTLKQEKALTTWLGTVQFMKMVPIGEGMFHCAALTLVEGRYTCAIYEHRPQPCRDFRRGGLVCMYHRKEVLPLPVFPAG